MLKMQATEWRRQLRPILEGLAEEIEEIEQVVESKHGISAAARYRKLKYKYARSLGSEDSLKQYWREAAKEYLSALGEVSDPLQRLVPKDAYRSRFLDSLRRRKLLGEFPGVGPQNLHIEPSLAVSDPSFGTDRQAGYDQIGMVWTWRSEEANNTPLGGYALEAHSQRSSAFHGFFSHLAERFQFVTEVAMGGKRPVARFRLPAAGCDLTLTNSPSRRIEHQQIDMQIMIAPRGIRPNPELLGRESTYIPITLSRLVPGYAHAYGSFRNDGELGLCIFAGFAFSSEIMLRIAQASS